LRIEECDGYPAAHGERIYELYLQTLAHAEMVLEKLPLASLPAFFLAD